MNKREHRGSRRYASGSARAYDLEPCEMVVLTERNVPQVARWCDGQTFAGADAETAWIAVSTPDGVVEATVGDCVARTGEEFRVYPCKRRSTRMGLQEGFGDYPNPIEFPWDEEDDDVP